MNIPENYKFTKDHEYVKVDGNIATIGITDYAQGELGDIIFIDFTKSVGDEVSEGDVVCSIEAVKTVSEVFSPIKGKLVEINSVINDKASLINSDPYNDGWLFKIEFSDANEINSLLSPDIYSVLIG